MDVGDGGHNLFAEGLEIVDAVMLCIASFFFGIHMSLDFLLIGFCGICICLHFSIGFFLVCICLLEYT